ncbi:estradiol 17 beta-dehydrogenase [Apiospora arundinis]
MPPTFWSGFTQCFPPKPDFVEKDLPDLTSKVYIVTGATSGVGKELARLLYSRRAPLGRDPVVPPPDLGDLRSVKAAAERFLASETKLHVLFNNAGVMSADDNDMEKTVQGYEKQLGVNCLGPFLLTKLLTPILVATAADRSTHTHEVRVVFVSSFAAEMYHEKDVGIDLDNLDFHHPTASIHRYGISKVGVWAYGNELTKRFAAKGVMAVPVNPGNLRSELFAQQGFFFRLQVALMHYPAVRGAYTELFAGFSPKLPQIQLDMSSLSDACSQSARSCSWQRNQRGRVAQTSQESSGVE